MVASFQPLVLDVVVTPGEAGDDCWVLFADVVQDVRKEGDHSKLVVEVGVFVLDVS